MSGYRPQNPDLAALLDKYSSDSYILKYLRDVFKYMKDEFCPVYRRFYAQYKQGLCSKDECRMRRNELERNLLHRVLPRYADKMLPTNIPTKHLRLQYWILLLDEFKTYRPEMMFDDEELNPN